MEKWLDINGYEDYYQISNYGRIKSKKRMKRIRSGGLQPIEERVHKPYFNNKGYPLAKLNVNGIEKRLLIHRLVAEHFICEIPKGLVVNHIDFNRSNNHVSNLEIVTYAQNNRHGRTNKKSTSKYIGVYFDKQTGTYRSQVTHNRKVYNVGRFKTEFEAYQANNKKRLELGIETKYEKSVL